jgi:hypothetical protein
MHLLQNCCRTQLQEQGCWLGAILIDQVAEQKHGRSPAFLSHAVRFPPRLPCSPICPSPTPQCNQMHQPVYTFHAV